MEPGELILVGAGVTGGMGNMVTPDSGLQSDEAGWRSWDFRSLELIIDTSCIHGSLKHEGTTVALVTVLVISRCISYFPIAVTKQHGQGKLQKKAFSRT